MVINSLLEVVHSISRAGIAALFAASLALTPALAQTPAQPEPQGPRLIVMIVEGEGAINNIRERTAREPIVEVQDENHRPVAGAVVVFSVVPSNGGAGAAFVGNAQTAEFVTDQSGRAVARGFHPNSHPGQVQIRVTATSNGRTGAAIISQTNVLQGAAVTTASGLSALKIALIVAAVAGAAAGGAVAATHSGGSHSAGGSAAAPTTITPGTPTVGAP